MTDRELELALIDKCESLDLKKKAFDILETIFSDNSYDEEDEFWCGFDKSEIKVVFEAFVFKIERKYWDSIIRTRIGLFIENKNKIWRDNLEPIGYFELETDFNGSIIDDWFVIEKEKYVKDVAIISHFQNMNKKLPLNYLQRNHIQYEFVAYISLIGTLFISKQFEGAGRFIERAYAYLDKMDNSLLDNVYMLESKKFLKIMNNYLLINDLLTDELKNSLANITKSH